MSEGHDAPVVDTSAAVAGDSTGAAPVAVDTRHHADNHHDQAQPHIEKEQDSSVGRLTPRPTFMDHLVNSRDAQFHLNRRESSELERYFVGGFWISPPKNSRKNDQHETWKWANIFLNAISTVPVIWTSTRNGPSSCECTAVLPPR